MVHSTHSSQLKGGKSNDQESGTEVTMVQSIFKSKEYLFLPETVMGVIRTIF